MYNEQINNLIDLAIADGEITEKEKQILFRKAELAGIDLDEFGMVLEAKLHNRQKEGATSKTKDNVIKCPSCNDIVPALSRVCPSCNFTLDAQKRSSESEKGLEELISSIENVLADIKTQSGDTSSSSITSLLFTLVNSGITQVAVGIIAFLICYKLGLGWWMLLITPGILLGLYIWNQNTGEDYESILDRKGKKAKSFPTLKANFQKYSRTAKTLYGENRKVNLLLEELNNELTLVENQRKKTRNSEYLGYGVMALIITGLFFLPKYQSQEEIQKEAVASIGDAGYLSRIEDNLTANDFQSAKKNALHLEYSFDQHKTIGRIVKAEILFNLKQGDIQKAENVFFTSPKEAYSYYDDIAPSILQEYINKDKKNAQSFINKIDVNYDSGKLKNQLQTILKKAK